MRFLAIVVTILFCLVWFFASVWSTFFYSWELGLMSLFLWFLLNFSLWSAAVKRVNSRPIGGGADSPIVTPEKIVIVKMSENGKKERREAISKRL